MGALQPRRPQHGAKFLLCCKDCDGFIPPSWAGVQNLTPGPSTAKDAFFILWPSRLSVRPAAALLGALGREPRCRPHERGDLASAFAGKSGELPLAPGPGPGPEEVQSRDFGAARGPLGMAEGPEGITPGMLSSALKRLEEDCPGVPQGAGKGLGGPVR